MTKVKVTPTNQTLILAGERSPGRRRSDTRLATLNAEEVTPTGHGGGFTASRPYAIEPVQHYTHVQQILEAGPNYARVDVYA